MNATGQAAMILSFDVEAAVQPEHDEWHSHEHLLERLAIPGFERGSRWTALGGGPRYFVLYEVRALEVLESPAYQARLNNPSPWTARMMPAYRGMRRGLCQLRAAAGQGLGGFALLLRFSSNEAQAAALSAWLVAELLPSLASRAGLVAARWYEAGLQAQLTVEQRLRGSDGSVDGALFVTGYDRAVLAALAQGELAAASLEVRGAVGVSAGVYQLGHVLTAGEVEHRNAV